MSAPYLREDLAAAWAGTEPYQQAASLEGCVYRAVANRRTLRFEAGGRAYFAKVHRGSGWREILKNLGTLRPPVIGAGNEFAACRHLAAAGVCAPTVAGFGQRGWNPARRFSFVVCDALEGRDSLEDVLEAWQRHPPAPADKRRLVEAVAAFASSMHAAGVVHRDFYVCHLLLDRAAWADGHVDLAVIDLHRARIHRRIPRRWLGRDLAALLFSVLDAPLTSRDWLRFVAVYRGRPLREVLAREGAFWRSVHRRAGRLYRKGQRKGLVKGRWPGRLRAHPVTAPSVLEPADVAAAGRDLAVPFELLLRASPASSGPELSGEVRLLCREILRLLPGRRLVARVRVAGREAVLKLFVGAGRRRYRRREARGCARLAAAGAATPALLAELEGAGATGLLFEYLPGVRPLAADDERGVAAAAAELGRLHAHGLRYRDLHLDNFLEDEQGAIYVVDGDSVWRSLRPGPLPPRRSLEELGVLCAQRPPLADARLAEVERAYAAARRWTSGGPARRRALAAATARQRRRRVRRYLAKAQRECSEFHHQRTWGRWLTAVREAWDPALTEFAADPERSLCGAAVVKNGNSATVFRVRLGGRSRIVKRYNVKGSWHAVRRALKPTARFRLAWLNGQRLHFLGIATARPLALVERRRGPWRGVAYLVMEDLGARDLAAEVESTGLSPERLSQLVAVFGALAAAGLVHGDTKASNFLITERGIALVDLDAMTEGSGRGRDRTRFLQNFDHLPELRERLRRALDATAAPLLPGGPQ